MKSLSKKLGDHVGDNEAMENAIDELKTCADKCREEKAEKAQDKAEAAEKKQELGNAAKMTHDVDKAKDNIDSKEHKKVDGAVEKTEKTINDTGFTGGAGGKKEDGKKKEEKKEEKKAEK